MVKLNLQSSYNEKDTPFLYKWDTQYRKNYVRYQNEIDKLTYNSQRTLRGFGPLGSWSYPSWQQNNFLLLEIYKKKQHIGKVFPDELEAYSSLNPQIVNNLNRTFKAGYEIPYVGLGIGAALNVYASLFNLPYSFRIGFLVIPVAAHILYRGSRAEDKVNSLQFLDWLVQYRTAKSQIEADIPYLQKETLQMYKSVVKSPRAIQDLYNDLIKLVAKESHEELHFDSK